MNTSWTLRRRLIVWNIVSMAVILLLFIILMTLMIRYHVQQRIDDGLKEEVKEIGEEVQSQPSAEAFRQRFDRFYAEHGGFSFEVCRLDGTVLCGSPWLRAYPLPRPADEHDHKFEPLQDVDLGDVGLHRSITRVVHGPDGPLVVHVVAPHLQTERELSAFFQMLVWGGAICVVVACLAGLIITRHVMDPLTRMTHAAERISAENLEMSIVVDHPDDEIGRLAATLNQTFARLRTSLDQIRQFTSDAAHELRTPLAVMRTEAEVALRNASDSQQLRQSLETVLDQSRRLTSLIDQLLTLSRQDAVDRSALFDEVYLDPLLRDVVDSMQPLAEQRGVSLSLTKIPPVVIWGDDISLSRLFQNLIDNALKHTPAGGKILVAGISRGETVSLSCMDTGVGIAPVHWPRLFDRFYRVASSREGVAGGTGLGLAICRSIVELHRGRISVESEPNYGTTFKIDLPVVSHSEPPRDLPAPQPRDESQSDTATSLKATLANIGSRHTPSTT